MKKLFGIMLSVCMLLSLLAACGAPEETVPAEMAIKLGDTGVTVTLPTELGFEQKESELNDYFGTGANGEWCIIVNRDDKGDYELKEYAELTAEANGANGAYHDKNDNYYFTYDNNGYSFYTSVRESGDSYYRVAFYCFQDVWQDYADRFAQWACTIELS